MTEARSSAHQIARLLLLAAQEQTQEAKKEEHTLGDMPSQEQGKEGAEEHESERS